MTRETLILLGLGILVALLAGRNQAAPAVTMVPATEPIGSPGSPGGDGQDLAAQAGTPAAGYDFINAAYQGGMYTQGARP